MCCFQGAPRLAVEVRSEGDKRADCFAAATEVVSDVYLVGEDTVRKYTAVSPTVLGVFRRGQSADAAPAVPGWSMPVDDLFE